jgi:glycosyltransferase involved in cell wall biosynthesis
MRIAFVLARYGRDLIGGAETLAKGLACESATKGLDVEVWTTCAMDFTTWANKLPVGTIKEDGILVRRFPVDKWCPENQQRLSRRLQLQHGLDTTSEYDWVFSGPHRTKLNQYILENADRFDAIITMPYIQTIPFDAAWLSGDNVILVPCFHNELSAFMEPFRYLLEMVAGVVFISPEEARFAVNVLGARIDHSAVIGIGVENNQPLDTRAANLDSPYLLYVGRLEQGKNIHLLYDFVRRYASEDGTLKLVIAGDGPCKPPNDKDFIFLGRVTDEEKNRLYRDSLALCQPSSNESFSLVIMESWLAERPVLVWNGCVVTRSHVRRSKGRFWFGNYNEFKEAVNWFDRHNTGAARMGTNGSRYVKENYTWGKIFSRFAHALGSWGIG